ncbi:MULTISPECIES: hypothetical protein [Bacillus]|nr:hypothetical protein [Bacillus cereus]
MMIETRQTAAGKECEYKIEKRNVWIPTARKKKEDIIALLS